MTPTERTVFARELDEVTQKLTYLDQAARSGNPDLLCPFLYDYYSQRRATLVAQLATDGADDEEDSRG